MDYSAPRAGLRPLLALASLCVAFGIGVFEHHVHLTLDVPGTYLNLFRHKCGLLAFATMVWVMGEAVWLMRVMPDGPNARGAVTS